MKTVCLQQSVVIPNCSGISWCNPAEEFANDIQKLITRCNVIRIACGKHSYSFNHLPFDPTIIPFSFHETDLLMQLMPGESDSFYLKAALREYMNTFIVFNSKGERVYPEDIV